MYKKTFTISLVASITISLVLGFYCGRYLERVNTRKNFQNIRGTFQERPSNGTRRTGSFPEGFIPSEGPNPQQVLPTGTQTNQ